jgi:hypothetical protein
MFVRLVQVLVAIAVGGAALEWQDCALQTDIPSLHITAYAHTPDPEVVSENHTISKTYYYNGNSPLSSLKETVYIDKSPVHPSDPSFETWVPYFNNSFDLCSKDGLCPVNVDSSFSLSDEHPPSTTTTTGSWYRAKEYYFSDSVWIGCLTTIYQVIE